jgi:hypothetical protein
MVTFADGGDLGATAFVQLTPNDSEKIIYVRNTLAGSRSIILFQGTYNASNDYEVPAGTTAVVYFDGAGSGAVAANVFNNAYFDSLRLGGVSVTAIIDDDTMGTATATNIATSESIKAYVDAQVGANNELSEVLANGNTTGGTDIAVSTGDDITFADNSKAIFGAGSDLQIYHNSSNGNSYIHEAGSGDLLLQGVDVKLRSSDDGANMLHAVENGSVSIYYNGAEKLATESGGVNITGTLTSDGLTVDGNVANITLNNTDTTIGQQRLSEINFDQNDPDGAGVGTVASIYALNRGASSGFGALLFQTGTASSLADRMRIDYNGDITFYDASGNASFVYSESTGSTFNEQGDNKDFRVESDGNTHMLFVDASENAVAIGSASTSTASRLRVSTSAVPSGNSIVLIDSGNTGNVVGNHLRISSARGNASGYNLFTIDNAAGEILNINGGGSVVFNESGGDRDFRVESNNSTHMIFVDSDQNEVGINTSNPLTTLEVNGNFRPTYYYPHSPTSQTSSNNNYYWKLGTMYLAGPWGAELVMHGAKPGYSSGGTNVGKLTILFRGGTNASLLDAVFFAEGDNSSVPSPSVRYVPLGNYSFDIYVQLGNYASVSHTVVTGGSWTEQVVNTGTTNAPASSVGIPAQRSTWLGQNEVMSQYTYQTTINETSNDHDFRVESDSNANMLFVDAGNNVVGLGTSSTTSGRGEVGVGGMMYFEPGGTAFQVDNPRPSLKRGGDGAFQIAAGSDSSSKVQLYTAPSSGGTLVERLTVMPDGEIRTGGDNSASQTINFRTSSTAGRSVIKGLSRTDSGSVNAMSQLQLMATGASSYIGQFKVVLNGTDTYNSTNQQNCADFRGDTGLVLNQSGYANLDFRVESDSNTHMLYVDAGNNVVNINATGTDKRLRVDSGNIPVAFFNYVDYSDVSNVQIYHARAGQSGNTATMIQFLNTNASEVGTIKSGLTGTNYNTSSDYRLKENVVYDWDATTRLKQLKPARFNFIVDADTTVDGFLAHEAQTVVPEAVSGTHNQVDDNGDAVMQGIDQSKLVPLLVKTIQELEARITALENA